MISGILYGQRIMAPSDHATLLWKGIQEKAHEVSDIPVTISLSTWTSIAEKMDSGVVG